MDPDKVEQEKPFFLDFAFELPSNVQIESQDQARESITWGSGSDDD